MLQNYVRKNVFFIILCIFNFILFILYIYNYNSIVEGYVHSNYWKEYRKKIRAAEQERKKAAAAAAAAIAAAAAAAEVEKQRQRQIQEAAKVVTESVNVTNTSSGFYFKKSDFNCIYSHTIINIHIEYAILKNANNYTFYNDANNDNKLYSSSSNGKYLYKYKISDNNYNYVKFHTSNSGNFINCLLKFINECDKIGSLIYQVDTVKNIITIVSITGNKIEIYINNYNDEDENTIKTNINTNNIIKIINDGIQIDMNKTYTNGKLYYTGTDYFNCIVINNI